MKTTYLLTLALLVALAAWVFLLRPAFLGGPAFYVMVSGRSMEPALHGGDLAVTRKQDSYAVGDIVAFRVPKGEPGEGGMVIHRIVGGTAEEGFVTTGDNKEGTDPWRPKPEQIIGKMWFNVPGGGQFLLRLRQPLILGLLAGAMGMLMVLDSGPKQGKAKQRHPPSPPQAGGTRRRSPPLRVPPWRGLGLGLFLVLALLVISLAAYRSGKWL